MSQTHAAFYGRNNGVQVGSNSGTITTNIHHTSNTLPEPVGASFDSHTEEHNPKCLPNTRVKLLEEISLWIENPNSKVVFWLSGMAGTGKSTISRTVARSRFEMHDLGATFFFKRGEADRASVAKLVPTLAWQLISKFPGIKPLIQHAIDSDKTIIGKSMGEQFDKLVWEPLPEVWKVTSAPSQLVIVIDALDECEGDDDIEQLIGILSRPPVGLAGRL